MPRSYNKNSMILYLCAEVCSVVKVNGKPLFTISEHPKKLEIDSFSSPLIEISPLGERANSLCFYLDENFISNPPNSVILTKILGDYHLKIKRDLSLLPFKVISQKKIDGAVITVFCDRGYKISVESMFDYFLQDIDCQIDSAEIFDIDQNQNVFINLNSKDNTLCAFNLKEKISLVFLKKVCSFTLSPTLNTTEKFPTHLKHVKNCEWEFIDGAFKLKTLKVSTEQDNISQTISDKILPYVFLEGLSLGEDVSCYLCPSLIPHKQRLYDYLGAFLGVFPPPTNVCHDYVGLLYKQKENLYYTKFTKVDIENNKVTNVKIID